MILKNMVKELFSCSFANCYFGTWNEMNNLCQMVHHHQDGIAKNKRWKIYDEVHGNQKTMGM
jgi:arginine/lysine/ornithine decarboxylase